MKYIVKEYIATPGVHNWPSAEVITTSDDNVQITIDGDQRSAHWHGEKIIGYRVYDEAYRAQELCDQINKAKAQSLAEWRHQVYGEPIPVAS